MHLKGIDMQGKGNIKIGIIISYINLIVNSLANILLVPVMLSGFGQGEYGVYEIIGSLVSYLSVLNFGIGTSIVRYVSEYRVKNEKQKESNLIAMLFMVFCVLSLQVLIIGIILYFKLDVLYGKSLTDAELILAKKMLAVLILNMVVSFPGSVFGSVTNAYERFIFLKGIEFIKICLRIAGIIVIVNFKWTILYVTILDTVLNIAYILGNMFFIRIVLNVKVKLYEFDKKLLREVIGFSAVNFLYTIIDQINWKLDSVIIGMRLSSAAVAIYAVGNKFANVFQNLSTAISGVFLPKFTLLEVENNGNDKILEYFVKVSRWQAIVIIYAYLAYMLLGRGFINIWLGETYDLAWLSGAIALSGLAVPSMLNASNAILQAKKKQQVCAIVYFVSSIINMISTYVLVPVYGICAASLMTSISYFIYCSFVMLFLHYKLKINMKEFFLRFMDRIIAAAALIIIICYGWTKFIYIDSWTMFILNSFIYTAIYFLLMWFIGMNDEERGLIVRLIKRR
jgi:O-antigen/teichoic acid export membrane protein